MHMLTSAGRYPDTTVAGLETNTLWDGLFHAATWVGVAVGPYIWRRTTDWRWAISGRAFLGISTSRTASSDSMLSGLA